jgi:hypothetical protein
MVLMESGGRGTTIRTNKRVMNEMQVKMPVNSKALEGESCLWNRQRIIVTERHKLCVQWEVATKI